MAATVLATPIFFSIFESGKAEVVRWTAYPSLQERNRMLSVTTFWRCAYLTQFSSPAEDRFLYRHLRRTRPRTIVEIGMDNCVRATRLMELAQIVGPERLLRYTGIDLFDARPADRPRMRLKQAHRMLTGRGAQVRLVPGRPDEALARTANSLTKVDLLIVATDVDEPSMQRAWKFVPRMLHQGSDVFVRRSQHEQEGAGFCRLALDAIDRLAHQAARTDRLAA